MWIGIVKRKVGNAYETYTTIYDGATVYNDDTFCFKRFATEEEKQKLFDAIKENGYKWNSDTKTLEKLVEPEFKIGDNIRKKGSYIAGTVVEIDKDYFYKVEYNEGSVSYVNIKSQNDWELVPKKFDISTLKPFDKILVRDSNEQIWNCELFDSYRNDKYYPFNGIAACYKQCIPYKSNEHLLGTSDECDEFYKNW